MEDKTRKLMDVGAQQATKIFLEGNGQEPIMPVWLIESKTGELTVIGTPMEPDAKDKLATLLQLKMKELDAARYVFVNEAWMLSLPEEDHTPGASIRNHPGRTEAIVIIAQDKTGSAMMTIPIIRNGGKHLLGEHKLVEGDNQSGRFANLLPPLTEH